MTKPLHGTPAGLRLYLHCYSVRAVYGEVGVVKGMILLLKSLVVFMLGLIVLDSNAAGGYVLGKIKMLQTGAGWTSSGVYVLVEMDTLVADQPECATDQRLALDPATDLGKSLYAALLSAKHAQSTVEIRGLNECNVMGEKFESINLVRIK